MIDSSSVSLSSFGNVTTATNNSISTGRLDLPSLNNASPCKPVAVKKKRIRAPVLKRPVCPFEGCNMSFSTSGHLARHVKIHTGVKTHSCPIEGCEKKFARKDNMTHHYNTHKRKLEAKGHYSSKTSSSSSSFLQKDHYQYLHTSPTTTLVSESDAIGSDPEKDCNAASITSGRTATSVSPSAHISSFLSNGSALKNSSATGPAHLYNGNNESFTEGSLLHQRRPKSAPLCSINTSSSFLTGGKPAFNSPSSLQPNMQLPYHFHPQRQFSNLSGNQAANYVNHHDPSAHSILSAGAERLDFPFDLTDTFFDSPVAAPTGYSSSFSSNAAPLSAPHTMSHMTFDQLYNRQRPNALQTLSFAHTSNPAPSWSQSPADQLDQHFSSFLSSGERKRSISIEGTSLVGNRSSNAWSSFSLDL